MSFEDGGAYALLGPSGCGKTTLLNIVSGLVTPSQGSVRYDGRDVTGSVRSSAISPGIPVPVIYDTMTVAENLAFPLRNRGVAADRIRQRVARSRDAGHERPARQARSRPGGDAKQKISLAVGWYGKTSLPCSSTSP